MMVSGMLMSNLIGRKAKFAKHGGKIPPDYVGEDGEIVCVWTNPAGMVQVGLMFGDGVVFEPYLNQIRVTVPEEKESAESPAPKSRKSGG